MHARHHRRSRRSSRFSARQAALAAIVFDALEQRRLLTGVAPVPLPDGYTTDEDTPLVVAAAGVLSNDLDPELDALTAALNTGPANGSVELNADGSFTYTPNENFNGSDSFTYDASDGSATATATVTINVTSVNDDPAADGGGPYTVAEEGEVFLSSSGSADVDGTIASVEWDLDADGVFGETGVEALRGAEDVASPEFLADGIEGPDSVTVSVRVTDNSGATATDTATVNITAVNDNPMADNDDAAVDEDGSVLIDVLADDTGLPETGETLTVTSVGELEHGTAVIEAGQVRYTPDDNYSGGDTFSYTISDGNGGTSTAFVTVTVNPVNDAPEASEVDVVRVKEGQTRTITLPAEDTETEPGDLIFRILSLPGLGTLRHNGSAVSVGQEISGHPMNLTYTLARSATEVGDTAFTYEVTDGGDGGSGALTSDVMTVGLQLIDVGEPEFDFDAGSGAAFVSGTEGADNIVVSIVGGNLRVTVDGVVLSNTTPINSVRSVRVFGLAGDDRIDGSAADRSLYLQGGWGNDTMIGGGRRDVLDGRQGNDLITGGNHHDLLAGGDGEDDLSGGAGRDVLIGGAPPAASNYSSLRTIAEQWAETLRPVSPFSTGQGITDEEVDELIAGTGADWFIRTLGDVLDRADVQGDRATTLS